MTAIAYRNGTLAAGKAWQIAGQWELYSKIRTYYSKRWNNHVIVVMAGVAAYIDLAHAASEHGTEWPDCKLYDPDSLPGHTCGIVVTKDRTVHRLFENGNLSPDMGWNSLLSEGSAFEFVRGALAAGASALEAVQLAVDLTTHDAIGVDWVTWEDAFGHSDEDSPF